MKTWLVPAMIILAAVVGAFVIWWSEGTPGGTVAHFPPIYHRPRVIPPPQVPMPALPVSEGVIPGFACIKGPGLTSTVTPFGSGLSATLSGEIVTGTLPANAEVICLWATDNIPGVNKTYTLSRLSTTTDGMTLLTRLVTSTDSAGVSSVADAVPAGKPVCYAVDIVTPKTGLTYEPQACF